MSYLYTEKQSSGVRKATTPATDAVLMSIPGCKNHGYLALSLKAIVVTAATSVGNAEITLRTAAASPVDLAVIDMGTSAAGATFETKVEESLRKRTAGEGLQVVCSGGSDATSVFEFEVMHTGG